MIKTVPESRIVETLIEEAMRLADQMGLETAQSDGPEAATQAGEPTVSVIAG